MIFPLKTDKQGQAQMVLVQRRIAICCGRSTRVAYLRHVECNFDAFNEHRGE
uniref:Uncharacterized protein n=1 Tax=Anguilla anguilla TaxID=7936 RepID=A0A0E9V2Q8_ANGAN